LGLFEAKSKLAQQRASQGDLNGALVAIDTAVAEALRAQFFRARLLHALGRLEEALDQARRLDGPVKGVELLELRADAEDRLDLHAEAEGTLSRAIALAPERASLYARRGLVRRTMGLIEDAQADLDRAVELDPLDGEAQRLRLDHRRATPEMLYPLAQARGRVKDGSLPAIHMDFARAKALHDVGDYEAAAQMLTRANDSMRARFPYDVSEREALVAAVCAQLGEVTPRRKISGTSAHAPIFVTGLLRSGTTLIEQVLASHRDVVGAGEVATLSRLAVNILGSPEDPPPEGLDLSDDALRRLGHGYAEVMREKLGAEQRHTDKSLQSLLFAGPILAALPRAHMVVVTRDPRATAISIYRQVFRTGKQLFSYNLNDIRVFQEGVEALTGFWQARLPERFHIIEYEALVIDSDSTIRNLLDTVELSFDPACLTPEASERPVKTLSALAVRKPINDGALDAWRPYAGLLAAAGFET